MNEIKKDLEESNLKIMTNIYLGDGDTDIEITHDYHSGSYYLKMTKSNGGDIYEENNCSREDLESLVKEIQILLKYGS